MARIYTPPSGETIKLPWGFQINTDLVPLEEMRAKFSEPPLSRSARLRLAWMDYYAQTANVSLTCRRFGISRKTFYHWFKRYNPSQPQTLEDRSRAPRRRRQPEITALQEERITILRRQHFRYSKFKLAVLYQREYDEPISSWKIQRVIQRRRLYYHPAKNQRIQHRRLAGQKKKRITELKREPHTGFLVCLDAVVIYWNSLKRYIFTAIDRHSKLAFARMYTTKSSRSAADFLNRLFWLLDGRIENLQTDNGSEFQGYFAQTLARLPITHYLSRPHTPKDNPVNEHWNGTLQREFLDFGNFTPDPLQFNRRLTDWLMEYNFRRPHQTLGYETPIDFHYQHHRVLPMYPSSTFSCLPNRFLLC